MFPCGPDRFEALSGLKFQTVVPIFPRLAEPFSPRDHKARSFTTRARILFLLLDLFSATTSCPIPCGVTPAIAGAGIMLCVHAVPRCQFDPCLAVNLSILHLFRLRLSTLPVDRRAEGKCRHRSVVMNYRLRFETLPSPSCRG